MGYPEKADVEERWPEPEDADYEHGKWVERGATPGTPVLSTRCQKTKKDGKRCKRWSVIGLRYCPSHSGYKNFVNLQVYRERILTQSRMELLRVAPRAVSRIEKLIDDPTVPAAVQLKASTEVLDRVGIRGGTEVDVSVTEEVRDPGAILRERIETLAKRSRPALEDVVDVEVIEPDAQPAEQELSEGQDALFEMDDQPIAPPTAPRGL